MLLIFSKEFEDAQRHDMMFGGVKILPSPPHSPMTDEDKRAVIPNQFDLPMLESMMIMTRGSATSSRDWFKVEVIFSTFAQNLFALF
jgi:hypothetical protein